MRSGEVLILTTLYIEVSNVRMGNLLIQNRQLPKQVTWQCLPFTKMATKWPPLSPSPIAEFSSKKMARVSFFLIIHVLGFQNATSSATSPKREKLTISKYSQYGYQSSSFLEYNSNMIFLIPNYKSETEWTHLNKAYVK